MSNTLKALSIAWFINLILFTTSLFLWNYYDHIGNWSADAWEAIYATTLVTKLVLSLYIGLYIADNGLDGLKKESKGV